MNVVGLCPEVRAINGDGDVRMECGYAVSCRQGFPLAQCADGDLIYRDIDGASLRSWREAHALSQSQLAGLLGTIPNTIAVWERSVQGVRHPRLLALALEAIGARRNDAMGTDLGTTPYPRVPIGAPKTA